MPKPPAVAFSHFGIFVTDMPQRIPVDFSLQDELLWRWVEEQARTLPGFKPRAEWQAETARRMGRG